MDRPRLLLINNDDNLRPVMQIELEEAGWHVDTAATPRQALEAFNPDRHPAVLTDLRLSEPGHMKLISALRDRGAGTRLIVMADGGDNARAVEALRRGASSYLTKPVSLGTIRSLLDAPSCRAGSAVR